MNEALKELEIAIQLNEIIKELALVDKSFNNMSNNPKFKALLKI